MKKQLLGMIVMCAAVSLAFGQSGKDVNGGISLGGGTILDSYKTGGLGEFGFPVYAGNGWIIRNYVTVNGYGTNPAGAGIAAVGDKVTMGGGWSSAFETYAFVSGGIGAIGAVGKSLFGAPYLWDVQAGGGLQVDLSRTFAWFVELGGGWNGTTSDPAAYAGSPFNIGFASITMGFRRFF
jgi:hypothetical protein